MSKSSQLHVAVLGAGITGITTAYRLAREGCSVTVLDRRTYPAMETSFANGGQLSASNAEVWNAWSNIQKGFRWMLRPDAPLLVRTRPSWHKISWFAEFFRAIPRYESNTITTARLAVEARHHLTEMAEQASIQFDRVDRGMLHVYESKQEFDHAAQVSKLLAKGGVERSAVTPEEIRSLEPSLHGNFYGGFVTPGDFTGDIHLYTVGLAKACESMGVKMRFETEVVNATASNDGVTLSIAPAGSRSDRETFHEVFDRLVVCAGVGSRRVAALLGDRINVYPVKGYSITVHVAPEEENAAPWVGLLDDKVKIVTSRLGPGRLRVAGTAEFDGENKDIRMERIQPLINWCRLRLPGVTTRQVVPWAGLRPMMPDMMPRVTRGRHPGVFYNTGHGHLGWTLSAATADLVTGLVVAS